MKRNEMMIKNATNMHIDYIKAVITLNPEMYKLISVTKHVVVKDDTILFKDYAGKYLMTFSTKDAVKAAEKALYE